MQIPDMVYLRNDSNQFSAAVTARVLALAATLLNATAVSAQQRSRPSAAPFHVEEATVAQIHAALKDGSLTDQMRSGLAP